MAIDAAFESLHASSSTVQLCPGYDYNENRVILGLDNHGFEAIELNKRQNSVANGEAVSNGPQKWYKSLRGLFLTVLSALFFSVTTVIVKYVKDVDPEEMAFFRFLGNSKIEIWISY